MASRPRGSTKSSNPKTTAGGQGTRGGEGSRQSRAQRDDTPEAKTQNRQSTKTHPTRAQGSRRKDNKATGSNQTSRGRSNRT